jgi:glycosyltransferase involved in cell wall biosynthesis
MRVEGDVVLCSSSGWAHGVQTDGRKVVYCYTPARWLYQPHRYFGDGGQIARMGLATVARPLRRWDRRAAATADRYLTSSSAVQRHIGEVYGIEAEVLPPPHTIDVAGEQRPIEGVDTGFLLCVARLLPYKNVDVAIEAMRARTDDRLVVIGNGPEYGRLTALAPANVSFVRNVDDAVLRWAYANCRALLAASYEDFGLTPLEAAAFGRPTVALRAGGYLDTIIDDVTGVLFDEVTPAALSQAIDELDNAGLRALDLLAQAAAFDEQSFGTRLRAIVDEELAQC